MNLPSIDQQRARGLISRFPDVTVLVVGDPMVDRFIVGRVTRISPEAPVPVVRFEREYIRLGGAANVAHNLKALGANVFLIGVVGRDDTAARLREALNTARVNTDGLVEDASRPTVEKLRVVTERNQQVSRIDYEEDTDISDTVERSVIDRIAQLGQRAGVLLVSDYLKGTITPRVMQALVKLTSARVPLVVDPKIPHLDSYAGATLVTPNHHETEAATHRRIRNDEEARAAAAELRARLRSDAVLITRGEQGMWLLSPDAEGAIPAIAREVSDVTGAGDTVAATLALSLAAGGNFAEAAILAGHAASVAVGKFGTATVSAEEILRQFN